MKNNFQKIPLITSFLIFILFSAVLFLLYKGINVKNENAEAKAATLEGELNRREDLKSLNLTLRKLEDQLASLGTHFAKSSDVVPFLDTVERLAPLAGVRAEVNSVNTAGSNGVSNSELLVELRAEGSFQAVYKFLGLLENSPYELEFLSMDLHRVPTTEEGGETRVWEAIFRVRLLSFIPE